MVRFIATSLLFIVFSLYFSPVGAQSAQEELKANRYLSGSNYLDYDQDALKNWFPKNAVIYDKTVSEGAGQVRAISRLALFCSSGGNTATRRSIAPTQSPA